MIIKELRCCCVDCCDDMERGIRGRSLGRRSFMGQLLKKPTEGVSRFRRLLELSERVRRCAFGETTEGMSGDEMDRKVQKIVHYWLKPKREKSRGMMDGELGGFCDSLRNTRRSRAPRRGRSVHAASHISNRPSMIRRQGWRIAPAHDERPV
jgi:hypothetical protein